MSRQLAPLTGVVFVLLSLAAFLTGSSLDDNASGAKVIAYYAAHVDRLRVSPVLTGIAIVVGIYFFGVFRDYLRHDEGVRGLTATAYGGVILFASSLCLASGANGGLATSPSHLATASAQRLNLIRLDATNGFSSVGLAILLSAFGLAIVKSSLLPRWLGWVAFPFAIIALVPPITLLAGIATGIWTLIVSITLYQRQSVSATTSSA
jgi:hypothetical protein